MNLSNLINLPESDWLDFKSEWHANNANLILDILCLANSDAKNDRYLVIGYNESDKQIKTPTTNRKNRDELSDLLSKAKFNRIPTIDLQTIKIDDKELDIITIAKTNYRPYFLTDNKQDGQTLIRAGVIYTRNGSVNTPKDSSASESQISDMWRERFGLTLSPMEKLKAYIHDTDNWKRVENPLEQKDTFQYYYAPFPEFTIDFGCGELGDYAKDHNGEIKHANHPCGKTIGSSEESSYVIKYLTTILASGDFLYLDNNRHRLIEPDYRWVWYGNKKTCNEVHIETDGSFTTDTGLYHNNGLERINNDATVCNRAPFMFHIEGALKHGLQKILEAGIYYQEGLFSPSDEGITRKIYLIESEKHITEFARVELLRLLKLDSDPNPPSI